jgi:ferric-dicitrate binding protein FerR (iron transport regulator)
MPGLLRGVARTAAIAGTATAVSNRVSRRQAGRWAEQDQQHQAAYQQQAASQQQAQQQAAYQQQAQQQQPSAQDGTDRRLAQLQQLGELKAQGVLTQAEFEAQKARILGG